MTILERNDNGSFVARLLGPEDRIDGWQVVEERNHVERATIVSKNRSRLVEDWRAGTVRWL